MEIELPFAKSKKEKLAETLLKKDFAYMGDDGIVRCVKCNQPLMFYMKEANSWFPCSCGCAKIDAQKSRLQMLIQKIRTESGIPERYTDFTFDKLSPSKADKLAYDSCKNFADNYDSISKNGYGLYLYGDIHTARTYAACVANAIIEKGREVYFRKLNDILSEIQKSYNKKNATDIDPMEKYSNAGFLIIDNIGMEDYQKYGRDTNFVQDKVAMLVDNRYANKKPTMFTSCFDFNSLAEKRGMNEIAVQSIMNLSTRCFEVRGETQRPKLERIF